MKFLSSPTPRILILGKVVWLFVFYVYLSVALDLRLPFANVVRFVRVRVQVLCELAWLCVFHENPRSTLH